MRSGLGATARKPGSRPWKSRPGRGALDEAERAICPGLESELELGSRQIRGDHLEAGALESRSDAVPHARVERERMQEEDGRAGHAAMLAGASRWLAGARAGETALRLRATPWG